MARRVAIDELHVTVRVRSGLPDGRAEEIRRILAGDDFMDRLRRAIRVVVRAFPKLAVVTVAVTR